MILYNGTMEKYFAEAYQPIYFVADSNLTETDTVKVRVGLIEGNASRPVNSGGDKKDSKAIDNKSKITGRKLIKKIKEPEPLPENPSTYCFIGDIDKPFKGDGKVVVGKLELLIIRENPIPQKNDVFITEEPAMPEVILKAKLNNYNKGQVKFRWTYWITSDFPRKNKDSRVIIIIFATG